MLGLSLRGDTSWTIGAGVAALKSRLGGVTAAGVLRRLSGLGMRPKAFQPKRLAWAHP